jgi:N6-adenosine-specific RNA methylase IME4
MPALVRYEHARALVEQCVKIDEAKEIMDQAAALQAYARQRNDKDLENWVAEIKCRAAVQIGRLSREIPKASGSRPGKRGGKALPDNGQTKMEAIDRAGLSHSAVQRAEELAEAIDTAPTKAEQYYEQAKSTGGTVTLGGLRNALKGDRRKERESALAAKTEAASKTLGRKLYPVIYADPPWQFGTWSENGKDRSAENHYPTMTLDKLKAMPVPAAADCVLFLWATVPMLPQALEVMAAWGFTYKSHCVWVKDRAGTGYWFRNKHELLLVGTRGNIPAPAPGEQMDSVIACAARRHSEKPAAFAELIDGYFPTLEGIELFARGPRLGWDTWGAESDTETQGD